MGIRNLLSGKKEVTTSVKNELNKLTARWNKDLEKLNTVNKVDAYISALEDLLRTAKSLEYLENTYDWKHGNYKWKGGVHQALVEIDNKKSVNEQAFVDRAYEKLKRDSLKLTTDVGKKKKHDQFFAELEYYFDYFNEDTIAYIKSLSFTNSLSSKSPEDYVTYVEDTYYSDYPEKPFVSLNRDFKDWLARVEGTGGVFKEQMLVNSKMMTRLDNGLLPGHIYLLYWLDKQKKEKEFPGYFEYSYGIDANAEADNLQQWGLLDESHKLTKEGWEVVKSHWDIVLERTPKAQLPIFTKPNETPKTITQEKKPVQVKVKVKKK